ncbi:secreted metallopeptidase [Phlyctema vagabunda]|uniref:Secreted metallopeptidase n=1 Tax=Phlyctema vagabunda TaxID=108571 RepID=A0ABR4PIZ8_9HELO
MEPFIYFLACSLLVHPVWAAPKYSRTDDYGYNQTDPFAILDAQKWVNPDNMTWEDWRAPPGTNWSDPSRKGSNRNFNIALITVDYSDKPFALTLPVGSTVFSNPQPSAPNLTRDAVPSFYRDFLNAPNALNRGHTLHEYWMGDSDGRFGVDLTAFGAYRMPSLSYQYGISNDMNAEECVIGKICNLNIRTDALAAWRADVGNATAASYELIFILSAGQDESSTWQEFGEMRFQTKDDVPDDFGPPGNETSRNYARTRYVEWTSWASASTIWPNAGSGSSTQAESSGMATYAHELSHLLDIGDNYNNPYGIPLRRAYTGPWSMMSRGSFNGPGGPHTRWQIPPQQGGSMGSLHTMRDKAQLGLVGNDSILHVSREALAGSGLVVANIKARAVSPGQTDLMGIRVVMNADLSPVCDIDTDLYCDGGSYNNYDIEVVDRMGADSFTPDSGVMISKTKNIGRGTTFQWTIDANPQDIELLDFYRPDGTPVMITLGDYRQLADALFHAGTRSGSEYEYVDEANRLHFYIINIHRDKTGILSYTVAVRSLDGTSGPHTRSVAIARGKVTAGHTTPTSGGVTCSFELYNNGSYSSANSTQQHPQDVSSYLKSDVYRLNATVEESGWSVELPNALATARFGTSVKVQVAVAADASAAATAIVMLTATSESDASVKTTGLCVVQK